MDNDRDDQLERLRELLERRLANVPLKSDYFDEVDEVVADGIARHEAELRRLRAVVWAKRRAEEARRA